MQSVIHRHATIGLGPPVMQRLQQRLARLRIGEVDHRGRASTGGRHRPGFKTVCAGKAAQAHLQVDMTIHAAGNHIAAGRVDGARRVQLLADGRDPSSIYGQVRQNWTGRRDELPVPNCQFIHNRDAVRPTFR